MANEDLLRDPRSYSNIKKKKKIPVVTSDCILDRGLSPRQEIPNPKKPTKVATSPVVSRQNFEVLTQRLIRWPPRQGVQLFLGVTLVVEKTTRDDEENTLMKHKKGIQNNKKKMVMRVPGTHENVPCFEGWNLKKQCFEGWNLKKQGHFIIKTRVIWVPGIFFGRIWTSINENQRKMQLSVRPHFFHGKPTENFHWDER